ncbi:MAG: hypothetical protein HPY45_08910 [Anaerolineae bacterium]|nr:hypothetical protein [Anaerolineae bacterium]
MESEAAPEQPLRGSFFSLLLVSASVLAYQVILTRLFSVAQFYHFAFMVVSLALLGFGASGTLLTIFPRLGRRNPDQALRWLCVGTAAGILGSYILVNRLPFDSFSIAWDWRQVALLMVQYVALSIPFLFCGAAIGLLLAAFPQQAHRLYAVNLLGSALGCIAALLTPSLVQGEGTVVLSAALASFAGLWQRAISARPLRWKTLASALCSLVIFVACMLALYFQLAHRRPLRYLELRLSPYKSLSYVLQYPDARVISQRWNAYSRVDVVKSSAIRSLPGLSYLYPQLPPPQDGLTIDGDDLTPIVQLGADLGFSAHMPSAVVYQLRPAANVLVLDGRGGLEVLIALAQGAQHVVAVEDNPLVVEAAAHIYHAPGVRAFLESGRGYLSRGGETFDVIVFALTSSYHPVRSGAYSLAEDYRYTVEAFESALSRLSPDGVLVVTRWLQVPPSEELRAFAVAVTALRNMGMNAAQQVVALRSFNTATLLIKRQPFSQEEVATVRRFAEQRAFDMIYAPGILAEETNRQNVLQEPMYYEAFSGLLTAPQPASWYQQYPYDVRPPTDDHPFFGHFFKWSQTPQVLAEFGKTWQPFGGAGYFIPLLLLAVALLLSAVMIFAPLLVLRREAQSVFWLTRSWLGWQFGGYFALIGLGYLLVEIPLIQSFILFLGRPVYAMSAVLFSLLLFSALGSRFSARISVSYVGFLALLLAVFPLLLRGLFGFALGFALPLRLVLTLLVIAPLGVLMGSMFPRGIALVERHARDWVAWMWAINGAASVVSSVLAALLAISFGYRAVLLIGAVCYLLAWWIIRGILFSVKALPNPSMEQKPPRPDYTL